MQMSGCSTPVGRPGDALPAPKDLECGGDDGGGCASPVVPVSSGHESHKDERREGQRGLVPPPVGRSGSLTPRLIVGGGWPQPHPVTE